MATERCVIDDGILDRARVMKASGDVPDHIFKDEEAKGLRLRVRRGNASWELKSGNHTLSMGQLDRMFVKEAGNRARIGRDLLRGGIDPNPFFSARLAGLSEPDARRIAHEKNGTLPEPGLEAGPVWTLGNLMDRYIEDHVKLPKPVKNGPPKPPSEATLKEVRSLFARPGFDAIRDTVLAKLDSAALQDARTRIVETSTAGQAAKALVYLKSALTWASGLEVRPAGLADPWWTRVKVQPPGPVRTQTLRWVKRTHKGPLRDVLAKNLRRRQHELHFSQDALAHESGIHRTYVGGVERSERKVSIDNIGRLAAALDIEAWRLLMDD